MANAIENRRADLGNLTQARDLIEKFDNDAINVDQQAIGLFTAFITLVKMAGTDPSLDVSFNTIFKAVNGLDVVQATLALMKIDVNKYRTQSSGARQSTKSRLIIQSKVAITTLSSHLETLITRQKKNADEAAQDIQHCQDDIAKKGTDLDAATNELSDLLSNIEAMQKTTEELIENLHDYQEAEVHLENDLDIGDEMAEELEGKREALSQTCQGYLDQVIALREYI